MQQFNESQRPKRGAYTDARGCRWDPNNADLEGVVMKQSKWLGEWRARYLILKGCKLFFSKDESSAPHGDIDLIDCLKIKVGHLRVEAYREAAT
jgi:hypothetical protein